MEPIRLIALLTDFGLRDPYVAEVKARILKDLPEVMFLDLSHEIDSFDVLSAGFMLYFSYSYFPEHTLFLGIVDPGVGTKRNVILAQTQNHTFLVPDNGLLSFFVQKQKLVSSLRLKIEFFSSVSNTFHARDIFAPVVKLIDHSQYWEKYDQLLTLNVPNPELSQNSLSATVCYIDKFGNLILNLENQFLNKVPPRLKLNNLLVKRVRTYAELNEEEIGILKGSHGFVELCLNQQSLAAKLKCKVGQRLSLAFLPS